MNSIFAECKSLKTLPDISKWDLVQVLNIGKMFFGCESLISLPKLSNWSSHINSKSDINIKIPNEKISEESFYN